VSAKHPTPPAQPLPEHPFGRALHTWEAWSSADTWRRVVTEARQHDQDLSGLGDLEELTSGPDPLEALRANREVVETMAGWQWLAVRAAREYGHGWHDIADALGVIHPEQARDAYLETLERQQQLADRMPPGLLRFDPRWRELANDNDADRAHQHDHAHRARQGREEGDRER
jgi:hypothetical protein